MIPEIVRIQKIDILHIYLLVFDHPQFQGNHSKVVLPNIVIVIDNSIPIELHHVQNTLTFITNEEILDLLTILLSEIMNIVLFVDPTLEIDSTLEIIILHDDLHQDHVLVLRLHLEDLSVRYNQVPLKTMTTTQKAFQSHKANLKLTCIPLS